MVMPFYPGYMTNFGPESLWWTGLSDGAVDVIGGRVTDPNLLMILEDYWNMHGVSPSNYYRDAGGNWYSAKPSAPAAPIQSVPVSYPPSGPIDVPIPTPAPEPVPVPTSAPLKVITAQQLLGAGVALPAVRQIWQIGQPLANNNLRRIISIPAVSQRFGNSHPAVRVAMEVIRWILIGLGAGEALEFALDVAGVDIGGGGAGAEGFEVGAEYSSTRIVKSWTANGVPMFKLADGRMGAVKQDGTVRTWRPKKPIVLFSDGASDLVDLLKADKALDSQAKRLRRVLNRRAPARRSSGNRALSSPPQTQIRNIEVA